MRLRARLRPVHRCLSIVRVTRHRPVLGQPLVCRAATIVSLYRSQARPFQHRAPSRAGMYVIAVYRRQVASHCRSDGSVSTPSTRVRCVVLTIEVSRRRASRFYDPRRQRTDCQLRCVSAVCRRQTASQRRADGSLSTPPTQLRCMLLNIEVSRRHASRFYDPCRQRVAL